MRGSFQTPNAGARMGPVVDAVDDKWANINVGEHECV